jgi:fructose-1-phosphate kinase PfkB-like protein
MAGTIGELVAEMAAAEGIVLTPMRISGQTRVVTILLDVEAKTSTVLNPHGPEMTAESWQTFIEGVLDAIALQQPQFVVCTGSLPTHASPNGYAAIVQRARMCGAFTMVDAKGSPLSAVLDVHPDLVKVNRSEAAHLFVETSSGTGDVSDLKLVNHLLALGAERVVLTLGSEGALGSEGGEEFGVQGLPVTCTNPTGAGDAFLASLCAAYAAGEGMSEALRRAVALAAASVETSQPADFEISRLDALLASASKTTSLGCRPSCGSA